MSERADRYYEAMLARDARFDGKFFVGVRTTGIYCRPICPAKPKRENVEFYPSALAAEKAGYRPCLRCRPECAPLSPAWSGKTATVQRALRLIAEGALADADEDRFAGLLGVSARHLRRLFADELGRTPKQVADSARLDFARKLVVETGLPITEIAFAAGFSSIRRFNTAFGERFDRTPSAHRRKRGVSERGEPLRLSLSYRPPLDWEWLIEFHRSHRIDGLETIEGLRYSRAFRLEGVVGAFAISPGRGEELSLEVTLPDPKLLLRVVSRVRQMFDLDSDPLLIANAFAACSLLSPLRERNPGLRIPRSWDGFETATRTILGQLVSIQAASRMGEQLLRAYGERVAHPLTGDDAWLFPSARTLAESDLQGVGTTAARKRAIVELARLVATRRISFESAQDPAAFREQLLAIPGVGPWTAEYICLRALGDTDAFPSTDLILKRALELHPGVDLDSLRPWRSYGAIHLWKEFAEPLSKKGRKKG